MSPSFVLLDREGRLRAGWRLLLHLVMGVALIFAAALGVGGTTGLYLSAGGAPSRMVGLLLQSFTMGFTFIALTAGSALVLETRWSLPSVLGSLRDVGQSLAPVRGLVEGLLGMLIAALAMAVTVGIMAIGGMEMEPPSVDLGRAGLWLLVAAALVLAAWFEELLFRGYAYQWIAGSLARLGHALLGGRGGGLAGLVDAVAFAGPALLLSVAFGLMHLSNPSSTWLSTGNTVLAGVWFTVLLLRTRSLWPAITAHWAWNALTVLVLGLPVSGVGEESGFDIPSLISLNAIGPDWLSGGPYGPEGSVGCIVGLIVAIALSAILPRRSSAEGFSAARRLNRPQDTP